MAGANWDAYTLPDIWQMLRHENACDGADRIFDWDALTHDVRTQHRRLLAAKEELAAAWPPDKNASAREFIDRMDILAASMQQTLTRAEDTRAGLRGIIEAIAEAQTTIQPMIGQRAQVSDDLIPRWADQAEDEYDAKARLAMQAAESAIADHSTQLQPPDLFRADGGDGGTGREIPGETGSPIDRENSSVGDAGTRPTSPRATPIPVPVPHNPPVPTTEPIRVPDTAGPPPGTDLGPVLSGLVPPVAVGDVLPPGAVGGAGAPGVGSVPPGAPGGLIGGTGGLVIPPGFGGAGGVRTGAPGTPLPFRPSTPPGRQAVPVRTAMPSGSVIGANPGLNRTAPSTPGLMGQPTGGRPGQAADRRKRSGESSSAGGAADQTWGVIEGVSPVIRPHRHRHDHGPGPGVIGLDR